MKGRTRILHVIMKYQPAGKTQPGHRGESFVHCCTETGMGAEFCALLY